MACPACGYGDNPAGAHYCENCGAALAAQASAMPVDSTVSPAGASETDAASTDLQDAPTVSLRPAVSPASLAWTCTCGQDNPAGEEFCDNCGEARPAGVVPLRIGDSFDGFAITAELGGGSYGVQKAGPEGSADVTGRLTFGPQAQLDEIASTLAALDPPALAHEAGSPLVPAALASGDDPDRGSYLVLELPPGEWMRLSEAPALSPDVAATALRSLLLVADHAARAGRLLLLSPTQVSCDGRRSFLPAPMAPLLPVGTSLLADPAFLAPEVRSRRAEIAAWPAAAFAAAATMSAITGNALGFRPGWHALMGRLLADEPAARPVNLQEVLAALAGCTRLPAVALHRTAFRTDIGHHHPVNQDAGGVWSWQRWDGTPVTLGIVADGVSAGERSEDAAALAVELLRAAIQAHWHERAFDPDRAVDLLIEAGLEANRRIAELPASSHEVASATTLVAVCLVGGAAAGIWCGDSRAYGVTPEGCRALTRDHSWVNIMVDSGRMTLAQAKADRRAHVIARWLGFNESRPDDPGFECFHCELAPGGRLLVCSDGLYMYFDQPAGGEAELAEMIYRHGEDVARAVDEMVQAALDRGGYDNITAVLVAAL